MAQNLFAAHVTAGNASAATLYTMPSGTTGSMLNITAYNPTGGALTLTLRVVENNGDIVVVAVQSIGAGQTFSFSGGSTARVTLLVLEAGNIVTAQDGSGSIIVRGSGLQFT